MVPAVTLAKADFFDAEGLTGQDFGFEAKHRARHHCELSELARHLYVLYYENFCRVLPANAGIRLIRPQ